MGEKILVVDDQPGIRMLLEELLISEGYKVTAASDGREGLDNIFDHAFDLIILDYKLPVIDGSQVLKRLHEENITVPVIVMSGLTEEIQKNTFSYQYVKQVLAKPFNIQDMCSIVKEILE